MNFSERYKAARISLGMTQAELAKALDVSVTAVQSYEGGKQFPGGKIFEAFARLGIDTNWLLTGEGEMKRSLPGGHVANGNGIIQGHRVAADEIHIDVHTAGKATDPPVSYQETPAVDIRIQHLYSAFRGDIHKLMVATILVDMTAREVDALSAWMKDNVSIKERGLLNKG